MAPPLFSTISAVTELFVTAAVVWFFYRALKFADYRFGVMTVALVYEALFNVSYMVYRSLEHEEGVTHQHPGWVTAFVAFHGSISLLMFLGLIGLVVWSYRRARRGEKTPLSRHPRFVALFLVLWGISILTGEVIYLLQWTDVIQN